MLKINYQIPVWKKRLETHIAIYILSDVGKELPCHVQSMSKARCANYRKYCCNAQLSSINEQNHVIIMNCRHHESFVPISLIIPHIGSSIYIVYLEVQDT